MVIGGAAAASDNVQTMLFQEWPYVSQEPLWRLAITSVAIRHTCIGIEAHPGAELCQTTYKWRHRLDIREAIDTYGEDV